MYNGICQCRNNQIVLRWSISQLFVVINLGALSLLGTQKIDQGAYLWFGVVGFAMNGLWVMVNLKSQAWVVYWNTVLAKMEPPEMELSKFRVFTGIDWNTVNKRPTFHAYLNLIGIFFCAISIAIGYL